VLAISKTIRRTQTPDGAVLLDVERGQMFSLNPIGTKILELLDEGHDEAQISEHMSAVFGVAIETVRVDVRDFLEALSGHEILQCGPPAAGRATGKNDDGTNPT
jgi:Coenzyme PQQ synthesis protein D (PqqD)